MLVLGKPRVPARARARAPTGEYVNDKQSNICLKKKFVQRVSPAKKIPAQGEGEKKKSCKLKIPLPSPPPITFLMVRPLCLSNGFHLSLGRSRYVSWVGIVSCHRFPLDALP